MAGAVGGCAALKNAVGPPHSVEQSQITRLRSNATAACSYSRGHSSSPQGLSSQDRLAEKYLLDSLCRVANRSSKRTRLHSVLRAQVSAPVSPTIPDEQEYVRKGGPDWPLVTRQARKKLPQPRIASKLKPLAAGVGTLDFVVVGCGPAGLALAAEAAKQGVTVGLIGPDVPFVNNYGVWFDEFKNLGLEHCLDHVWKDASVYLKGNTPMMVGRAYGRVGRDLLRDELLSRCQNAGVLYLDAEVEDVQESERKTVLQCSNGRKVESRLVTMAVGAAAGKFIKYEAGGLGLGVQTAYGIEAEVDSYPFEADVMHFMDFRDYDSTDHSNDEDFIPSFLYAMPLTPTKIFFEETCLAARPAMAFEELKRRLWVRLEGLGIKVKNIEEEEWSYIPVGGTLPVTTQQNLAFGAAANMIHPATGYSIVRSLSEAPQFAAEIAAALKQEGTAEASPRNAALRAWDALWSQERKRQSSFFVFGLELIMQMNSAGIRDFFLTFFRLPEWMWRGFLACSLSSTQLIPFALTTFAIAPNSLRLRLVEHLMMHPSGSSMVSTYAGLNMSTARLQRGMTIAASAFVGTVVLMAGMMYMEGQ